MPANNLTDSNDLAGTPGEGEDDDAQSSTPPSLTLPPDAVRNSPEYKALQRQLRAEARARGRAEAEAAAVRTQSAEALQAAEAQRQQAIAEQLRDVLGEDGIDAFNEMAELSETDPVAAARKFRELASQFAQSGGDSAALAAAVAGDSTNGGTPPVTGQQQTPPPVPGQTLSGDAPLGQATTGTDWDAVIADSTDRYAKIVERNQDPVTRARVTDRDRGEGFMAWLSAAYVKGMRTVGRLPR
ncbi:MAG TPA: hypothetical protein VIU37_05755 [Candidatus Limnocylindrales bacterium]